MPNAAGGVRERSPHDQEEDRAVAADLVRLIEHVRSSLRSIEQTIAGEATTDDPESFGNVVVLDDVSPRYLSATAALRACEANLDIAFRSLCNAGDRHAASQETRQGIANEASRR